MWMNVCLLCKILSLMDIRLCPAHTACLILCVCGKNELASWTGCGGEALSVNQQVAQEARPRLRITNPCSHSFRSRVGFHLKKLFLRTIPQIYGIISVHSTLKSFRGSFKNSVKNGNVKWISLEEEWISVLWQSPLSIFEKYSVYLKNKNMAVLPTLSLASVLPFVKLRRKDGFQIPFLGICGDLGWARGA